MDYMNKKWDSYLIDMNIVANDEIKCDQLAINLI